MRTDSDFMAIVLLPLHAEGIAVERSAEDALTPHKVRSIGDLVSGW